MSILLSEEVILLMAAHIVRLEVVESTKSTFLQAQLSSTKIEQS